ncbi:unnamed protein product [Vitrella brassicaformis CCMP3155]|uniref:Uncharacterized protein n=1 Tax=Vitrella brassicaformis (strain CCMP3155) TaxID=1169540 RepID=A0A0G4FW44_VITBC|nr:unnamed protein product [Vitrella brassicaformis CCMP3155]|mmetsp:Transcript_10985/g.26582  ORF Transcript_10985/g.26582 Transcript_10985/m.26582 type:complete len:171 (-) Transcript_10985:527-1039(-)|eukprot:CEM19328.1 unnamed protein product [Vitrella brassicaformis CCMP3155]
MADFASFLDHDFKKAHPHPFTSVRVGSDVDEGSKRMAYQFQACYPSSNTSQLMWQDSSGVRRDGMNQAVMSEIATAFLQNQKSPIVIQNNTETSAESKSDKKEPKRKNKKPWLDLSNRFTQLVLLIGITAAVLLVREHLAHQRRMDEMQRRIDGNPLLKGMSMLAKAIPK